MDPIALTGLINAIAVLGDVALIIIAPAMVINTIKIIKLETIFNMHVAHDMSIHTVVDNRLNKHGSQIDELYKHIQT